MKSLSNNDLQNAQKIPQIPPEKDDMQCALDQIGSVAVFIQYL